MMPPSQAWTSSAALKLTQDNHSRHSSKAVFRCRSGKGSADRRVGAHLQPAAAAASREPQWRTWNGMISSARARWPCPRPPAGAAACPQPPALPPQCARMCRCTIIITINTTTIATSSRHLSSTRRCSSKRSRSRSSSSSPGAAHAGSAGAVQSWELTGPTQHLPQLPALPVTLAHPLAVLPITASFCKAMGAAASELAACSQAAQQRVAAASWLQAAAQGPQQSRGGRCCRMRAGC
mmetsp:Transcript_28516/g.76933  ORF Transcript_28516/g.76933 Transcript_28516/m.76933 type:complete len:237 (+) Transcript_28516:1052-1762(+)